MHAPLVVLDKFCAIKKTYRRKFLIAISSIYFLYIYLFYAFIFFKGFSDAQYKVFRLLL